MREEAVMPTPDRDGLRRLAPVLLVYVGTMGLLAWGLVASAVPYTDPRFAASYFATEVGVAVLLAVMTLFFFAPARIGLRLPSAVQPSLAVPMLLLVAAALGAWVLARMQLPPDAAVDNALSLATLRTTLMVGVTEEWTYRGILFAALSLRFGLRRGAYLALVLFGLLHALNLLGGVPLAGTAVQVPLTMLVGSLFLLAAVGTRSLLLPMLCHGLYDFLVIDGARLRAVGSSPEWPALLVMVTGVLLGAYGVWRISRLQGDEPYPVAPR